MKSLRHGVAAGLLLTLAACRDRVEVAQAGASSPPVAASGASSAPPAAARWTPIPADDAPKPPPPAPFPDRPPVDEPTLARLLGDSKSKLTSDVYETVLLRLAPCVLGPLGLDASCKPAADFRTAHARLIMEDAITGPVALRYLRHPAPVVRFEAVSRAAAYAFAEKERRPSAEELYLDALRSEEDPAVLQHKLYFTGVGAARNEGIRRFVSRAVDHGDERVRAGALRTLAHPDVLALVPLGFERMVEGTSRERGESERVLSCRYLGETEDPRAPAVLTRVLEDPKLPEKVRGACFLGLVNTWTRSDEPRAPSREGYLATMRILTAKPRSKDSPHERGVLAVASARSSSAKWQLLVRDFYDPQALTAALASVSLDDDAGSGARFAACRALVTLERKDTLEATKSRLSELGLGESPFCEGALEIQKQLDDLLPRGF